jgi:hypothetical protein
MVADLARITYDPTRHYRSLIAQQGRVTLEADVNEGAMLASETLRLETIDIVGPTGSLHDGYKVSSGKGSGGVTIGPGTFYLGGWRLHLDTAIDLSSQPDWVDAPSVDRKGNLLVALLLTEQSVCAVEDQALREVALGGPDSAARTRLMQHFLRLPMDGNSCSAGADTVAKLLSTEGVKIDPATLQLMSDATLLASFVPGPPTTDPCTPAAAGGYLGADNQMVRVTVIAFDAGAKTGTLLWGWNNASLLYRAKLTDPKTSTLTFSNTPVDEEHAPQLGQMVEILRTSAVLGDDNYIAAHDGFVTSVAQAYSFDTQQVILTDQLPKEYQDDKNPLFVRLWQASVPFTAGKATPLDNVSGITVTITLPALPPPNGIAARPFWRFAVRPSTPQAIYPQRYADTPQPPDGPRQWLADLAVVAAQPDGGTKLVADCRIPFVPLTEQSGGCCGLVLGPDEVAGRGGLQAVVDKLAGTPAVLSLRPGKYGLAAPLKLDKRHKGLTIEGCTGGVIIEATPTDLTPFLLGLVQLDGTSDVALRRLTFIAPLVQGQDRFATLCCVSMTNVRLLTIEACVFNLNHTADVFGGGVVVLGSSSQVTIRGNNFSAQKRSGRAFGVLAWVSEGNTAISLDQWDIDDNRFENLLCAVYAYARLGLIACRDNLVVGCGSGFVFYEANLGSVLGFVTEAMADQRNLVLAHTANAVLRADLLADIVDRGASVHAALPPPPTGPTVSDEARVALAERLKSTGAEAFKAMVGTKPAEEVRAAPAPAAPPTAAPGPAPPIAAPSPAPPPAAAPAPAAPPAADTKSFDKVHAISVAAEIAGRLLTPALRIDGNEVTLTADGGAPFAGFSVTLAVSLPGSVMASNNRVVVPDATTMAGAIMFPAGAVVSGNLLAQVAPAPQGQTPVASLVLVTRSLAIEVASNMISFTTYVTPAPPTPTVPVPIWGLLNTTIFV